MIEPKKFRDGLPFFARLDSAFLLRELSRPQCAERKCKLEEYHN